MFQPYNVNTTLIGAYSYNFAEFDCIDFFKHKHNYMYIVSDFK